MMLPSVMVDERWLWSMLDDVKNGLRVHVNQLEKRRNGPSGKYCSGFRFVGDTKGPHRSS